MRHKGIAAVAMLTAGFAFVSVPAWADGMDKFHAGPVFKDYGKVATVDSDLPIPADTVFKVLFTSGDGAKAGELDNQLTSAARFMNMNVEAGVSEANIHVAIVLHGPAGMALTDAAFYGKHNDGKANPNSELVKELLAHGAQIYICGQSSAYLGITKADLLPGVKMALSAMDANVLLQQQGYVLIP